MEPATLEWRGWQSIETSTERSKKRRRASNGIRLLSGNGKILKEYYSDYGDVEELLSYGDLSVLGKHINSDGFHNFDNPEKDVCVYYARDRGDEHFCKMLTYLDIEDFMKFRQIEEYNYFYKNHQWFLIDDDNSLVTF